MMHDIFRWCYVCRIISGKIKRGIEKTDNSAKRKGLKLIISETEAFLNNFNQSYRKFDRARCIMNIGDDVVCGVNGSNTF